MEPIKASEIKKCLEDARNLLSVSGWERNGKYAVDILGRGCDSCSMLAVSYCAIGAINAVMGPPPTSERTIKILEKANHLLHAALVARGQGVTLIAAYNDWIAKSREDILSLYDEAMVLCEEWS